MTDKATIKREVPALLNADQHRLSAEFLARGSEPMRVALLFNADEQTAGLGAFDAETIGYEAAALAALGHKVTPVGVSYANLNVLDGLDADFIFNGCEGTGLDGEPGVEVVLALEKRLVPFSGTGSSPYQLSNDKWLMKRALALAGVPVPLGVPVNRPGAELPAELRYPLFVKPRHGFGSLTIDADSCAANSRSCRKAIDKVLQQTGADALVEQFIDGRELTVAILGSGRKTLVLPPLEVRFGRAYADQPRVRMRATKIDPNSDLYWGFNIQCPAELSDAERRLVEETALKAYRAIEADGFGRVDIRFGRDGVPYVLEVNANCSLEYGDDEHDAGLFPLAARAVGWSYPEMLARIIGAGKMRVLKRYRKPLVMLGKGPDGITSRTTTAIRRGTPVLRFGMNGTGPDVREFQHIEAYVRFARHSEAPNLAVEPRGSAYCVVTTRPLPAGEALTIDHEQLLSVLAPESEQQRRLTPKRTRRRRA